MSDQPEKPGLNNEHRYMALLALTSQELPARSVGDSDSDGENVSKPSSEPQAFYERLDADPQALESFLRHERSHARARVATQHKLSTHKHSRWTALFDQVARVFAIAPIRYATVLGVAIASLLIVIQVANKDRLNELVEQSYADVKFEPNRWSVTEPTLPWERPQASQGFAPAESNNSVAAIEFAQGLIRGREFLIASSVRNKESPYYALGEWNVLLWAACDSAQPLSPEFWRRQRAVASKLSATSFPERDSAEAVTAHLRNVSGFIDALVEGRNSARTAKALAGELLRFREQFAPREKAVVGAGG
jgi:hypothetical protein